MNIYNILPEVPVLEYQKDGFYMIFSPELSLIASSETKDKAKANFNAQYELLSQYHFEKSNKSSFLTRIPSRKHSTKDLSGIYQKFSFLKEAEELTTSLFKAQLQKLKPVDA